MNNRTILLILMLNKILHSKGVNWDLDNYGEVYNDLIKFLDFGNTNRNSSTLIFVMDDWVVKEIQKELKKEKLYKIKQL